jgi:hypothetical protein
MLCRLNYVGPSVVRSATNFIKIYFLQKWICFDPRSARLGFGGPSEVWRGVETPRQISRFGGGVLSVCRDYWITSRNDLEHKIVSKLYILCRLISLVMTKHGNPAECLLQTLKSEEPPPPPLIKPRLALQILIWRCGSRNMSAFVK